MNSSASSNYGFYTLTFLVIANMIGAGVFTTSGYALADLGTRELVVAAWIVGGIIAITGAISYGMLSRVMPESGGEYLFLSRAAHPFFGYLAGWVSLLAGFSGAIAFAAVAMEQYLTPLIPSGESWPRGVLASTSIVFAGCLHGLRPRWGALLQNGVVVLKLVMLAAILIVAAVKIGGGTSAESPAANPAPWLPESTSYSAMIAAFTGSLVWISLSYSGFNAAVYLAGEVRDAKRVVPRAMATGAVLVAVLYVLLNAAFLYGSSPDRLRGIPDVAAAAASSLAGPQFESFVRWTIALCLLTSVFSMMMAAPRVYSKMAQDGFLPRWLSSSGPAPWGATIAQMILAVTLVAISGLQDLLSYLGLTLSLSAACSVSTLFLPKVRQALRSHEQRDGWNGSRVWYAAPLFYIVATITSAVLMTYNKPANLVGTGLTFLVGSLAYALTNPNRRAEQSTSDR